MLPLEAFSNWLTINIELMSTVSSLLENMD